jgi:hypothetical protein
MSTFAQMRAVIADDLDRSDLSTQINRAINRAIKYYEKEPFWFKETVGTFSTTATTKIYTTSTIPTDISEIDYMEVVVSGNDYKLTEKTYNEIEEMDISHQGGIPEYYAYYDESIYLYPIPDDTYTVRISYTKTYTELSGDSDTNDWTTEAEDLIEARALWTIYARTIKDDEEANKYKGIEQDALETLRSKTEQYSGGNSTIRSTDF